MIFNKIKTSLFIAWRYLFAKKKHTIVNIISAISVAGVAVCTAALIIVLSVFNGMEDLIVSNFNSFNPDLEIKPLEGKTIETDSFPLAEIKKLENVKYVDEIVSDMVLVTYGETQSLVSLKGVSDNYFNHFAMKSVLIDGVLPEDFNGDEWILLGATNAGTLQLNLNKYQMLKVHYPKRTKKNFANPMEAFNSSYLTPIGVFATKTEYDEKYMFAPIDYARELMNYDGYATSIEIKLKDIAKCAETQKQIKKIVSSKYSVKDRYEQEALLFKTMKTEKLLVYVILTFLLILAIFNAIGSLGMMIVEKKEDISILLQLGASRATVRDIFLFEGAGISLLGGSVGMFLGFLVCLLQQKFHLVTYGDGNTYIIQYYPVAMHLSDFLIVFCIIFIISILSSYFPTRVIKEK